MRPYQRIGPLVGHYRAREWEQCDDCYGVGVVNSSVSAAVTRATLRMLGWRFLDEAAYCPDCWKKRREARGRAG